MVWCDLGSDPSSEVSGVRDPEVSGQGRREIQIREVDVRLGHQGTVLGVTYTSGPRFGTQIKIIFTRTIFLLVRDV